MRAFIIGMCLAAAMVTAKPTQAGEMPAVALFSDIFIALDNCNLEPNCMDRIRKILQIARKHMKCSENVLTGSMCMNRRDTVFDMTRDLLLEIR